jgi:hypothetical protein
MPNTRHRNDRQMVHTHTHTTNAHIHTHTHTNQCVKIKMLQYFGIKGTHRQVRANRPDIIIKYRKEKTCIVVDVATVSERNVIQKEVEKNLNGRVYVEHETNDHTCNYWNHWNSNNSFK